MVETGPSPANMRGNTKIEELRSPAEANHTLKRSRRLDYRWQMVRMQWVESLPASLLMPCFKGLKRTLSVQHFPGRSSNNCILIKHGTLASLQETAEEEPISHNHSVLEGGILYHPWQSRELGESHVLDQIVLPRECKKEVLICSNIWPLWEEMLLIWGGSTDPNIHWDVADYCRSCATCQRFCHQLLPRAHYLSP